MTYTSKSNISSRPPLPFLMTSATLEKLTYFVLRKKAGGTTVLQKIGPVVEGVWKAWGWGSPTFTE